jgi:hypothetical protein
MQMGDGQVHVCRRGLHASGLCNHNLEGMPSSHAHCLC